MLLEGFGVAWVDSVGVKVGLWNLCSWTRGSCGWGWFCFGLHVAFLFFS